MALLDSGRIAPTDANLLPDYDSVISALGRNVILAQIPLLSLAEASPSIHTFYPSEYGTDIEYGPSSPDEKPHQLKLKVRAHIRQNVRRLKITYLVTGPYSDLYIGKLNGDLATAGSFDVKNKKATLLGTGEEKVSFTTMRDVGVLLVSSLKTPFSATADSHPNERILKVNSFTTTPNEILAQFEKQTGAKWEVDYTPLDTLREKEKEAWEKKSPVATVFTLRRIWTAGGTLYKQRDNGKVGEPETETLEAQVAKAISQETSGFQSGEL